MDEDKRKERRRIQDQEDHDKLITMDAKLTTLCTLMRGVQKDMKDRMDILDSKMDAQHEACACRMRDCNHFFVPNRVFYAILTLGMIVVTSVTGVAIRNKSQLDTHMGYSVEASRSIDNRITYLEVKMDSHEHGTNNIP